MIARTDVDTPSSASTAAHRLRSIAPWALAVAAFVVSTAFATYSIATNLVWDLDALGGALWDFRDASYFSVTAWLDGIVPYDVAAYFSAYPVAQEFGLLPPTYLVAHLPLQVVSFPTSGAVMVGVNVVGSVGLATWSLRLARYRATPVEILFLSAVLIAGNAGRNTIYNGQSALLFTAGTYLALTARTTWPGSVGVFIAMIKPAFGIPLAVLLAAAGNIRRSLIGIGAAAVASALLMIPMVSRAGGLAALVEILEDNAAFSASSEWVDLATTTSRIDVTATIAMLTTIGPPFMVELLLGVAVIAIAGWAIASRRTEIEGPGRDAFIVLVCFTSLICIYHSFYDMVILTLPVALVVRRDFAGGVRPVLRWVLVATLAIAWFNPFRLNSISWRLTDSLDAIQFLSPGITGLALLVGFAASVLAVREVRATPVTGHSERS